MDRYVTKKAMFERHLLQAERHVAEGERHIDRQRKIVAELQRDGHPVEHATSLLQLFETLQAEHVAHRNRVHAELALMSG